MIRIYGKETDKLTIQELSLLSIDIDLLVFEKLGVGEVQNLGEDLKPGVLFEETKKFREYLMGNLSDGGDYSFDRFKREFLGGKVVELGGVFTEYELVN